MKLIFIEYLKNKIKREKLLKVTEINMAKKSQIV